MMSDLFAKVRAVPLAEVVKAFFPNVALTADGRNLAALCPLHSENTASFKITPEKTGGSVLVLHGAAAANLEISQSEFLRQALRGKRREVLGSNGERRDAIWKLEGFRSVGNCLNTCSHRLAVVSA